MYPLTAVLRAARPIATANQRVASRISSVTVTLVHEHESVVLGIDDDGAGLRVDDCERVFDRFVRLDEARHRDEGGSGLGLAIVDSVAKVHGGRATARPGPGGHFEVALPARRSGRFPTA